MSEWVDEWMGCENSKYEALSTADKKQRGSYRTNQYEPRIDANSSAIQAHWAKWQIHYGHVCSVSQPFARTA